MINMKSDEEEMNETTAADTADAQVSSRKKLIAIIVAVIAVVAVIVGGILFYQKKQRSDAQAACTSALDEYSKGVATLEKDETAGLKLVETTTEAQVSDKKLIETLQTAASVKPAKTTITCDVNASAETLTENKDSLQKALDANKTADTAVVKAQTGLEKDIKATALNVLNNKIGEGQKLFADSAGKVADENTRTALDAAVKAGQKVVGDTKSETQKYVDATTAIQQAIDAVNNSINAKNQADAAAAAQAQAQSSARGNTSTRGKTTYRGYAKTPSRPRGNGGGAAAPNNGGSTGGGHYDMNKVTINPNCVPGHTGFCPIG